MLYNPQWNEIAPYHKPLSLQAVRAWLETKNPEERYNYLDSGNCLAAQYNWTIGRKYSVRRAMGIRRWFNTFDRKLENIAYGTSDLPSKEHTFGAALERINAKLGAK